MKIKTKKRNSDGIVRLETSGNLKEIIINEDFMNQKNMTIALCFRGKDSSGIVELTPKEIEMISNEVTPRLSSLKNIKTIKFSR